MAGLQVVRIRVRGQLGSRWTAWFDGFALSEEGDETTLLTGCVVDQPSLHGLLARIRDLGIELISVSVEPEEGSTQNQEV